MADTLNSCNTLYLDLEMSEGNKQTRDIVQLGICEVDTYQLKILRSERFYIKPDKPYTWNNFLKELTGITEEDIKSGRPFNEVLNTLKKFGVKNKMTFSWGKDHATIQRTCDRLEVINPFTTTDLSWVFKNICKEKQNVGLDKALKRLGLEFIGRPHDAMDDAINTARIHMELLRRFRISNDLSINFDIESSFNLENIIDKYYPKESNENSIS